MGDKPNPFSAKVKKSKLKAFGSGKRKGGATAPPKRAPRAQSVSKVVPKKENPFRAKTQRRKRLEQELEQTEAQIATLMIAYEKAFDVENKLSDRWDKLKPGSAFYNTTQKKWNEAMREVERIQSRLLGLSAVRRKIKEQL